MIPDLKLAERKTLQRCSTGLVVEDPNKPARIIWRGNTANLREPGTGAGVFPEQHGPAVRSLVAKGLVERQDDGSYLPTDSGAEVLEALRQREGANRP